MPEFEGVRTLANADPMLVRITRLAKAMANTTKWTTIIISVGF
jgi:hypothetical protein